MKIDKIKYKLALQTLSKTIYFTNLNEALSAYHQLLELNPKLIEYHYYLEYDDNGQFLDNIYKYQLDISPSNYHKHYKAV